MLLWVLRQGNNSQFSPHTISRKWALPEWTEQERGVLPANDLKLAVRVFEANAFFRFLSINDVAIFKVFRLQTTIWASDAWMSPVNIWNFSLVSEAAFFAGALYMK
jgi:hypothetical protein